MGARHALFRPFAAPRTVKIPESPRGWYGADRLTQQGQSRFRRSAVLRLRRSGRDSYARWLTTKMLGFLGSAAHSNPGNDRRRSPPAAAAADFANGLPRAAQPREPMMVRAAIRTGAARILSTAANDRKSHASRRGRVSSGECVGPRRIPDRPRARRRRLLVGRSRRARMSFGPGAWPVSSLISWRKIHGCPVRRSRRTVAIDWPASRRLHEVPSSLTTCRRRWR
jgi:hypothetical protein